MRWFIRNVWRYRKQLWRFRTWDWEHNYRLFFESLRDTRDSVARSRNHEAWQRDVRAINAVLARWEQYETAIDRLGDDPVAWLTEEEYAWARIHRILEHHARCWWD